MSEADIPQRPERTRERIEEAYTAILSKHITPENISTYGHDALKRLQEIRQHAYEAYARVYPDSIPTKENVYAWAHLQGIDEWIEDAEAMNEDTRKDIDDVITTLQKVDSGQPLTESRLQFDRVVLPYLLMLNHVLGHDFDIEHDEQSFVYIHAPEQSLWVTIPELERVIVFANDSTHVHLHILNTYELAHIGFTLNELQRMPALERAEYIRTSPEIGSIVDSALTTESLRTSLAEAHIQKMPERFPKRLRNAPINELSRRRAPYRLFEEEVALAWSSLEPKPSSIQEWYHGLGEKRPAQWPSNPQKYYSPRGRGRNGWVSWPALVGSDVPEPLSFETLRERVRTAWIAAGKPTNVQKWYMDVAPSYRSEGWPGNPENYYKSELRKSVWQSWKHLVGEQTRATQLPFATFKSEVAKKWIEAGSPYPIDRWYRSLNPRPQGWDSNPQQVYKSGHARYKKELNGDWNGWSDLVGVPDGRIQK